jgi:hypothetical protein
MSPSVRSRLRDHGGPRPHGGGEHAGIEPEGIAHETDGERDVTCPGCQVGCGRRVAARGAPRGSGNYPHFPVRGQTSTGRWVGRAGAPSFFSDQRAQLGVECRNSRLTTVR